MASFKDPKRRMAILIADLYYESEQHQKALSIYQRLENRELGTLSKNELAYVIFGIFSCLAWYPNIDEITYLSPRIKLILATPSEGRMVLGYSNRLMQKNNIEAYLQSLKVLEYYIIKYPDSEEMETICFFYIDRCKLLADTFRLGGDSNIKLADELYERLLKVCKKYLGNNNMNLYRDNIESIFSSIQNPR
jgi:tetratricopeptide (TPR) repeat protein